MELNEIIEFLDYKELLKKALLRRPRRGYGQMNKMAHYLGVHSSLVSQVINGDKHFTQEQAIKVAAFLAFTPRQTDFFMLLINDAKAGNRDLKHYYRHLISKFREEVQTVASRLDGCATLKAADQAILYSEWTYIAIWLCTSLGNSLSAMDVAKRLNLSVAEVEAKLDFLLSIGLCERTKSGYNAKVFKTHIKNSATGARSHHVNWRLKAIEQADAIGELETMFTAPISVAEKDLPKIRDKLLDVIQEVSNLVKDSPPERLACLNIDFFQIDQHTPHD